mgnify:FL=1
MAIIAKFNGRAHFFSQHPVKFRNCTSVRDICVFVDEKQLDLLSALELW